MFNLVKWYKFSINGKLALVPASSFLAATSIIENEGFTSYTFIEVLD